MNHVNLFKDDEENHSVGKYTYVIYTRLIDPDSTSFRVHFDSDEECIKWVEGHEDWWLSMISNVRWLDGSQIWPTPDWSVILKREERARKKAIAEQIKRDLESSKSKGMFDGAYFGKAYETRNGEKAILIHVKSLQFILEDLTEYTVTEDGYAYDDMSEDYDIVGEW